MICFIYKKILNVWVNMTDNTVTFFDKKKEYRPLSNFWDCVIEIYQEDEIRKYKSGELCFHGEKYTRLGQVSTNEKRKNILLEYGKRFLYDGDIKTSKEAKQKGGKGKYGLKLQPDELKLWNKISEDVQLEICKYKMKNYEDVREWLKKSGNKILIHPAMRCNNEKIKDKIWEGRFVNGEIIGQNKLGYIWMNLREDI